MCSRTRGPAKAPDLVTWPSRKTAISLPEGVRRWGQVNSPQIRRCFSWCPFPGAEQRFGLRVGSTGWGRDRVSPQG